MDSTTPNIAASAIITSTSTSSATSGAKATPGSRTGQVAPVATTERASEPQRDPRSLQYQVDGDRVVTTVVDENSKTVVVQIPDAEVIRIAKAIDRMQGFLLEDKA